MKEAIIKEIVEKVFQKAIAECPKHSKYALSNYIADSTSISSRTLERLHDKYLSNKGVVGEQNEHTINDLCKYLNFDSYADYVKQNSKGKLIVNVSTVGRKKNWKVITVVSLIVVIGLVLGLSNKNMEPKCMVWKTNQYIKADCEVSYKESVVPLDEARLKNFKKVEVDLTTEFFDETTSKPLVWYYKSGNEIEYFSAPGLHPVSGKTLKAVTPYIIQKHVPLHNNQLDSFVE
ncbi:hypothetical protein D9O36_13815 [Zobellia amurskyensis]|uniref:Uncharacterized protein n=2 Tax=Zobellia amurskyensis TaxID=248905 RepID=A0A7X2ZV11_9FLAO|nr:hypothetical protein [Zobellia amurskyensis]